MPGGKAAVGYGAPVSPSRRYAATGLVVGAAISVQFGSAVAALVFPLAGPMGVVTLRIAVAAVILLAVLRPRLRGRTRRDWLHVAAFGIALAAMNTLFYHAIDRIPLGIAVTFEVLGPLAVYVLLGRRAATLLWALLALAGIYLLGGASVTELDPVGVAFAVGAGGAWAAYIVFGARVARGFTGAEGLALALGIGALLTVPLGWASAGSTLIDPQVLGIGVGVALLSSVVPYSLEMAALRRVSAGNFAVMVSLYPLTAALAGFLVLGQRLTAVDLLGMVLVAAAVAGATRASAPPPPGPVIGPNPPKGG